MRRSTRPVYALPFVSMLLVLLGGCTNSGKQLSEPPESEQSMPSLYHEVHDNPVVALEEVASIEGATGVVATPEGYLVITKIGELFFVDRQTKRAEILLDLKVQVSANSERGLLGLALHHSESLLYLNLTNLDGNTEVREYSISLGKHPTIAVDFRMVLTVEQPFPEHNGGNLVFGPDDYLYISLGDGGFEHDPFDNAQNPSTKLGSILRIDPSGTADGLYSVPPTNPFTQGGGDPSVWVIGLRNPWRFSFDPVAGDLWIGDVGHNGYEEVNRIPIEDAGGANFGWDLKEGSRPYENSSATPASEVLIDPIWEYPHEGEACAVTGGQVYRGDALDLDGAYVFADVCIGNLWSLTVSKSDQISVNELGNRVVSPVSFSVDIDGELLVVSLVDGVFRLTPP